MAKLVKSFPNGEYKTRILWDGCMDDMIHHLNEIESINNESVRVDNFNLNTIEQKNLHINYYIITFFHKL